VSRRYLDRLTLAEALDRIARSVVPLSAIETVPVDKALGRTLAASVAAARNVPHYPASAMDGVAVTASALANASATRPVLLRLPGEALRVDTGDPIADPFDAVIRSEDLVTAGDGVEVRAPLTPWANVRGVGEDCAFGDPLLPGGRTLAPWDLALLAAAGVTAVPVRPRPRVAFLPTGDEIVPAGSTPGPGEIPETNSLMIAAMVAEAGGDCWVSPPLPDDPAVLAEALARAARDHDLVVLNAGSAAGRDDHCPGLLGDLGELLFHGLLIMPGRPAYFGRVGGTPVLGLPGYPVSAYIAARLLLLPILSALTSRAPALPWETTALLDRSLPSRPGVREFVRVALGRVGGALRAYPLSRGAGVLSSLSAGDGLVAVPEEVEGLAEGTEVRVEGIGSRSPVDATVVLIGSNDPALALLEGMVRRENPSFRLLALPTGSQGGLAALARGRCHLAACHLLDPESGEENLPWCRRLLPQGGYRLLTLCHRTQGLMVPQGNPLGITGVSSLADGKLRFVNRQPGSGTRILVDHLLAREGIDRGTIHGFSTELLTHAAVAATVAGGMADAGPGVEAAAVSQGLSFVPFHEERFELVVPDSSMAEPAVASLLAAVASDDFRHALAALHGYRADETGAWRGP
jgi:putative molybdopterin biosynthesis protein